MVMTPNQIELVQKSFAKVAPLNRIAAEMFFERLSSLDPTLRIAASRHKVMTMLGVAVRNLHSLETLLPAVRSLGHRNGGYGLRDEDYVTISDALLWTLHKGLGRDFTPQVAEAWVAAYELVTATMKTTTAPHRHPERSEGPGWGIGTMS